MNDFDQIMANANSNTTKSNKSFDKNVWRERKQQERQEVYDLMDKTADEIKTDINKYKQYLDVQGRFDKYSVGNALVISATYPNATQIKEFDDWKESGAFIKKGANGIKILEPGDSYTRSDGSSAISYNVKKMFDISQTTSTQKPRTINYDDRVKLTALLKDCPVDIKAVDEIPNSDKVALWSKEDNVLYVKRGGETPTIFKQLAKELTRSALEETGNTELDNFKCESTSYMLCKKYGIDVSDININSIPEAFKNMSASEVRNELTWDDIDLEKGIINIEHNVYDKPKDDKGRWFIGTTKTQTGTRKVHISQTLKIALQNYKNKQDYLKKLYGRKYIYYNLEEVENKYGKIVEHRIVREEISNKDSKRYNLVFTKENGAYIGTDITRYPYKIIHNELGIKKCRFYDLRGSYATKILNNGIEIRDVADLLGHKNIETTENFYISSTESSRKYATELFDNISKSETINKIIEYKIESQ